MRKLIIILLAIVPVFWACNKDKQMTSNSDLSLNAGTMIVDTITLPQVISSNMRLTPDHLYLLDGKTFVTGGTLQIEPGTRIEGVYKVDPAQASALVITKSGKIRARGREDNPVIFTSYLNDLPGGRTNRLPGDWGGIVLLGDAPTNQPATTVIEGIEGAGLPEGVDITYGGSNTEQSSGVIAYTRIEFAGATISPDNELNSLTLAGIGKKTGIKYVMASYGADDAFEFFGGNVEPRYLIANSPGDDAFDFDFGYTGNLQFGVSVRNRAYMYADANGIESDNENPSTGAKPTTRPQLSNLTIFGNSTEPLAGTQNAAIFRKGTDLRVRNCIFAGYRTGIFFERTHTAFAPLFFRNNAVHAFSDTAFYVFGVQSPWGLLNCTAVGSIPENWFNNLFPVNHSRFKSSALVYKRDGPLDPDRHWSVKANYLGLTENFMKVPYIGALGHGSPVRDSMGVVTIPNNWMAGTAGAWVNFDPQ